MNAILMFSGGKDSFLSACMLQKECEKLYLVTYDNGCMAAINNVYNGIERLKSVYKDNIEFLGIKNTSFICREFFLPYFNMTPQEQKERFLDMTPSQFHCLICKTAMVLHTIWLAESFDIDVIADGARQCQGFCAEQPGMLQRYDNLLQRTNVKKFLHPVYQKDDWQVQNMLLSAGFVPKTLEPKCLAGVPICGSVTENVQMGTEKCFDEYILPKINENNMLTPSIVQSDIGNSSVLI